MGKADLHVHTSLGDGMATVDELLDFVERSSDLDVIAVTDHDDLRPALATRDAAVRRGAAFEVIVALEVTTLEGHLIGLFLEEPVPSMRPLARTIDVIHQQGGLCLVPHPMSWLTRSIGRNGLERIYRGRAGGTWFDAIEVANQSPAGRVTRARAVALNRERYGLAEAGGSDAHFLQAVGSSFTVFPGRTGADLRQAIVERTTSTGTGPYPSLGEIGYHRLVYQQLRSWTVTPRRVLGPPVAGLARRVRRR